MITSESIVRVTSEQVSTELGGEVAILSLSNGVYYGLDDVGTFVWRQIQNPCRVQELERAILGEYDVDEERCRSDLYRVLGELQGHGLIDIETDTVA